MRFFTSSISNGAAFFLGSYHALRLREPGTEYDEGTVQFIGLFAPLALHLFLRRYDSSSSLTMSVLLYHLGLKSTDLFHSCLEQSIINGLSS